MAGGASAAFIAFAVAALMIVILIFGLALIVGAAQQRTVDLLKAGAPTVRRWGGRILLGVGVWFIALGVFSSFFAEVFPV